MLPQFAAHAAGGPATISPRSIPIRHPALISLISHSRAVAARVSTTTKHAVLDNGHTLRVAHLRKPIGHARDIVPSSCQRLPHGGRYSPLEPHKICGIGRADAPVHEARTLDGYLDLHPVVERIGQDLRVEHGLTVAAHV